MAVSKTYKVKIIRMSLIIDFVQRASTENLYYQVMNYNCTISHNKRNIEQINRERVSTIA
jgi:hypothetical protein